MGDSTELTNRTKKGVNPIFSQIHRVDSHLFKVTGFSFFNQMKKVKPCVYI
jgi:hypothetical protein